MHVFYSTIIQGKQAILNEEESLHLSKVLRLREGEHVAVIDGKGAYYEGTVELVHARHSTIKNLELHVSSKPRPYKLHLGISPTKMMERFEWFLEKAVEIGIDRISPLQTKRTERSVLKMSRLEKIVLAAMKQSKTPLFPKLDELRSFDQWCTDSDLPQARFIAHCMPGEKPYLSQTAVSKREVCVFIGPEGDFTADEIQLAIQHGFQAVSLGESRLRAETAGIVTCAQIQSIWQRDAQ
jgi:16S rRNA (uracil1498-N3)-methyltransferase